MHDAEWQTRRQRIDTRLRSLSPPGEIVPRQTGLTPAQLTRHAVTEFPTANGPADYALYVNGQPLGILEAKKVTVNTQNVLEQAKRYGRGAADDPGQWNGYRVPFLYATNGEILWFLDVREDKPVSRRLSAFHTPSALAAMFEFDHAPRAPLLTAEERVDRELDALRTALTSTPEQVHWLALVREHVVKTCRWTRRFLTLPRCSGCAAGRRRRGEYSATLLHSWCG